MMLKTLREEICHWNLELLKQGLVRWTGGNVSLRDPASGYVLIKPSGVLYEQLNPERMVILDPDGNTIEGALKPSSDAASHLYVYRHRPDVNGVVHTHSAYATAFAAVGRPIPVYLTAQGDEFGGPIPCGGFALIGSEDIGRVIVEGIGASTAILLKNHGVFTIGKDAEAAVKSAVMVEEIARTVWLALQIGQPEEIPAEQVAKLHHRYRHIYGQPANQG